MSLAAAAAATTNPLVIFKLNNVPKLNSISKEEKCGSAQSDYW